MKKSTVIYGNIYTVDKTNPRASAITSRQMYILKVKR